MLYRRIYERNVGRHLLFNEISNIPTALFQSFAYTNEIIYCIYSHFYFIVRN